MNAPRPRSSLLLAATVAALAAIASPAPSARAFSVRVNFNGQAVRWAEPHVTYYVEAAGSDDLTPEASTAAVEAGFASWTAVDCANLTFEHLGDAPDPKKVILVAPPDGKNELVWIEDDSWDLGQWVLGVTTPITDADGFITEADIAFNGFQVQWTDGGYGSDMESVAVHEIGHMFGLQHNLGPFADPWSQPTMAPNVAPDNASRSLEQDDIMAVCFLYPADGLWTCQDDTQCPKILSNDANGDEFYAGAFTCDGGLCASPTYNQTGIAVLGQACEQDATCVGDLYCQPFQDNNVCAQYCKTAEPNCPEGFDCVGFSNHPQFGACLPADGQIYPPGQGPGGCAVSTVCGDGWICAPTPLGDKKVCATVCEVADPLACPDGESCFVYSEGKETGVCFPNGEIPGASDPAPEPGPEPSPEAGPEASAERAGAPDAGPTDAIAGEGESDTGTSAEVAGADGVDSVAPKPGGCAAGSSTGGGGPLGLLLAAGLLLLAVARRR